MLCVSVIWPFSSCRDEGAVAVQHAAAAALQAGRMLAAVQALAGGLDADQARVLERDVGWKMPMALLPPPTQATTASGCWAFLLGQHGRHLRQAFLADHALEVAHHHRVGVGPATVPMM